MRTSTSTHSDRLRDSLPRVLRLSDSRRNDLRTEEREGRRKENRPEGQELSGTSLYHSVTTVDRDLSKRSGVAPVPEANGVVIGTSAGHEDNAEDDQDDNGDDFDRGRDKFGLRPHSSATKVDDPDEDEENGDVYRRVRLVVPVLHDNRSGDDLGRNGDRPGVPCC